MQSYLNKAQVKSLVLRYTNHQRKEEHERVLRMNEKLKAQGELPKTWLAKEGSEAHQYERVSGEVIDYLEKVVKEAVYEIATKQRGKKKTIMVPIELC